ncbi:MAG: peptidase MA domain-containing protein [Chloroflexi bacterium]|nr:peptidase MA domain-containing protein [Chloroflexota bacterium]
MRLFLVALLLSLFVVFGQTPAGAQGELSVIKSSTAVDFPSSITFSLDAQSPDDITKIELKYWTEVESCVATTSKISLKFDVGKRVQTSWPWEMRKSGGLPPGAVVNFQWILEDGAGQRLETPPEQVVFYDGRYNWRKLEQGYITLFWYSGDDSFALSLMDAAQKALVKLEADTGATIRKQVQIYVYANSDALKSALVFPQEWTGGVAFSGSSIIALGISVTQLEWGRRALAHELAHLVVHHMTFNCYVDLPTWLDEGLAMYAEGPMEGGYRALLEKAIADDTLISVRSLSSSFPASAQEAQLAYAESYSLVNYLVQSYGRDKMFELLRASKAGNTYDEALRRTYGFDTDGLNSLWRAWLGAKTALAPAKTPSVPGLQPIPTFVPYGAEVTPTPTAQQGVASPTPTRSLTPEASPTPSVAAVVTPTPEQKRAFFGCATRLSDNAPHPNAFPDPWPMLEFGLMLFPLGAGIVILRKVRHNEKRRSNEDK